jgi:hypothetical protein
MNKLMLGDHAEDMSMELQELVVDTILQECSMFAATVPKTYLQAQKSKDWVKWKGVIDEELNNLKSMQVWSALPCPEGRRPLGLCGEDQ